MAPSNAGLCRGWVSVGRRQCCGRQERESIELPMLLPCHEVDLRRFNPRTSRHCGGVATLSGSIFCRHGSPLQGDADAMSPGAEGKLRCHVKIWYAATKILLMSSVVHRAREAGWMAVGGDGTAGCVGSAIGRLQEERER
jgi:hypothetical protein